MGRKSRSKRDARMLRERLDAGGLLGVASDGRVDGHSQEADRYRAVWERLSNDDSAALDEWLALDFDCPLTLRELVSLAYSALLALRLGANGREAIRPIAIRALQVSDRLDQVERLVSGSGASVNSSTLHDFWFATLSLNQCLLSHLQLHPVPDVLRAADPDAYAAIDVSGDVTADLLSRAHRVFGATAGLLMDRRSRFADDESVRVFYAEALTLRLTAEVQYRAISNDGRLCSSIMTDAELKKAVVILRAEASRLQLEHRLESAVAMESAALAGEGCLTGPTASLARSWDTLVTMDPGDAINTVHRYVMAIRYTPVEEPSELFDRIEKCIDFVSRQGIAAARLRAHAWPHLANALAAVALAEPARSSRVAWRLARFDGESPPEPCKSAHVWVLNGKPPTALIETADTVTPIALPEVDYGYLLRELVGKHAEEYDEVCQVDGLRKELGRQFRPLCEALASLSVPVTIHAFGVLKHVPYAALTGSGSILAVRPHLTIAPRRASQRCPGTVAVAAVTRLIVHDRQLTVPKLALASATHVVPFDSRKPSEDPGAEYDDEVIAELLNAIGDCRQFVFFGHGYVDQFATTRTGLVVRNLDDGWQRRIPVGALSAQDFRRLEWAVLLACGAGQGGVFVESDIGIADAFTLAGAQHVIAPLWPITEATAADFLTKLLHEIDRLDRPIGTAWANVLAQDPNRFGAMALIES